jgi:DNA-binding response OmpR family regulator
MSTDPAVLVVDDGADIRANMEHVLSTFGCRVDLAADGERTGELAARNLYDVALVDLRMPGIDGVVAVRRYDAALIDLRLPGGGGIAVPRSLRQRNTEARTIVMVSDERAFDATLAHEFEQAGIPLFVKPLDLDRLLAAIALPEAR